MVGQVVDVVYGDVVGKVIDVVEVDGFIVFEGCCYVGCVVWFDVYDLNFWVYCFDVESNFCSQVVVVDGNVYCGWGRVVLLQNFYVDCVLVGDDVWVVEGVNEGQLFVGGVLMSFGLCVVVGIVGEYDFFVEIFDGFDFDLRSCCWYDDCCCDVKFVGGECDVLCVIVG